MKAVKLLPLLLAAPCTVLAHEAPTGWNYDLKCCHNRDCHQIHDTAVMEGPGGYAVAGSLIPYGDPRIRQSRDGHFHLCIQKIWMGLDYGVSRHINCLYVPPRGF
jgi:hypothetical protein